METERSLASWTLISCLICLVICQIFSSESRVYGQQAQSVSYLSDRDKDYHYLEFLQQFEYNVNPRLRRWGPEAIDVIENLAHTVFPGVDITTVEQRLNAPLPTRFEFPPSYILLHDKSTDIQNAARKSKMKLSSTPKIGTLPTAEINAKVVQVPGGSELVIVNDQLFDFTNELSKVLVKTIPIEPAPNGQIRLDASPEKSLALISSDPKIGEQFLQTVLEFLLIASPKENYFASENERELVVDLFTGMELFAVGHEYGHVIKNHGTSEGRQLMAFAPQKTIVVPNARTLKHSWAQELEADEIGFTLMVEAVNSSPNIQPSARLYCLSGALILIKSIETLGLAKIIIKADENGPTLSEAEKNLLVRLFERSDTGAVATSQTDANVPQALLERFGDHPPPWLRLHFLARRMKSELGNSKDSAGEQRGLALIGQNLLNNLDPLLENITPQLRALKK
jgi:hypothetical protein